MFDLYYSDCHLREDRLDSFGIAFEEIFQIGVRERVIETGGMFINGGDTFHVKGAIKARVLDFLYKTRRSWKERGLKKHVDVVGNHDQEDRDGQIHALKIYEEFPGWKVIDRPEVIKESHNDFLFCPYMRDLDSYLKTVPISMRAGVILVCHAGFVNALMNNTYRDTDGYATGITKGFKDVFSGHYHKHHTTDNVNYIGSIMQHSFSEVDQEKGVIIYDRKKATWKFVPIKGTPKFKIIGVEYEDESMKYRVSINSKTIKKHDYVRVDVRGSKEQVKSFSKDSLGIDCKEMSIGRDITGSTKSRIEIDEHDMSDVKTLMEKFVGHIDPDGLNKETLMRVGEKMI